MCISMPWIKDRQRTGKLLESVEMFCLQHPCGQVVVGHSFVLGGHLAILTKMLL